MDEKTRRGASDGEVGRSLARGRVPPSPPIVLERVQYPTSSCHGHLRGRAREERSERGKPWTRR